MYLFEHKISSEAKTLRMRNQLETQQKSLQLTSHETTQDSGEQDCHTQTLV